MFLLANAFPGKRSPGKALSLFINITCYLTKWVTSIPWREMFILEVSIEDRYSLIWGHLKMSLPGVSPHLRSPDDRCPSLEYPLIWGHLTTDSLPGVSPHLRSPDDRCPSLECPLIWGHLTTDVPPWSVPSSEVTWRQMSLPGVSLEQKFHNWSIPINTCCTVILFSIIIKLGTYCYFKQSKNIFQLLSNSKIATFLQDNWRKTTLFSQKNVNHK